MLFSEFVELSRFHIVKVSNAFDFLVQQDEVGVQFPYFNFESSIFLQKFSMLLICDLLLFLD